MGRRSPHALIAAAFAGFAGATLAACIPPREPARHLGGEAHFLGAYVRARAAACQDGTFELELGPRPRKVIETLPAIYESRWELRACGQALVFHLDCAMRGETWGCSAHDWPMPVVPADDALAQELEAVARRAPSCPPERSCVTAGSCAEDGLVLRRLPRARGADLERYEVTRCGLVSSVNVRCTREAPLQCVTAVSAAVDATKPSW